MVSHQRCAGWPQGLSLLVSDGRVVGRGAALSAWSLCGYWCFEGFRVVLSCGCCRHGLGIFCEKFEFIFVGFWIIIYVNTG